VWCVTATGPRPLWAARGPHGLDKLFSMSRDVTGRGKQVLCRVLDVRAARPCDTPRAPGRRRGTRTPLSFENGRRTDREDFALWGFPFAVPDNVAGER